MRKTTIHTVSIVLIVLAFCFVTNAQTVTPTPEKTVEVTESFVQDANRAFDLIVAQREALAKYAAERTLTIAERDAANGLVKSMDELILIKDRQVAAQEKLNQIYAQMIEIQGKIITQLENRLNRPKGFYQKFLDNLKVVIEIAVGIAIGRGL